MPESRKPNSGIWPVASLALGGAILILAVGLIAGGTHPSDAARDLILGLSGTAIYVLVGSGMVVAIIERARGRMTGIAFVVLLLASTVLLASVFPVCTLVASRSYEADRY